MSLDLTIFPSFLTFSARDKCERVTCGANASCDSIGNCACNQGFQGDGQKCDGKKYLKAMAMRISHCY